jgi:hypothetical protein
LNQVYGGARTVDGLSYLRQQADEGIGEIFPIATIILVGGDTGVVELRKPFDLTLNERTIAMVDELLKVGIANRWIIVSITGLSGHSGTRLIDSIVLSRHML